MSEHPGHREGLRERLLALADSAERRAIGGNSQLDPEERALLLDAAAVLPSDPPQTCRDHGPHLGFHWCPECYTRAFTHGVESTKGVEAEKRKNAEAERDALKVKRDVALRAWKGAAADRDKAQRQVAELKAEVASLKVENQRLQHDNEQLATEANDNAHAAAAQAQRARELRTEVASLKVENERLKQERDLAVAHDRQPYPTVWAYERVCELNRELKAGVESLKAKLAVECTCRMIDKCLRCEAIDAASSAGEGQ